MAFLIYQPAHGTFYNPATGKSQIGYDDGDTLTFPGHGGTPYSFTFPTGAINVNVDVESKDAQITVPAGSACNGSIHVVEGSLTLGTQDSPSSVTINNIVFIGGDRGAASVTVFGTVTVKGNHAGSFVFDNSAKASADLILGDNANLTVQKPIVGPAVPHIDFGASSVLNVNADLTGEQLNAITGAARHQGNSPFFINVTGEINGGPVPLVDLEWGAQHTSLSDTTFNGVNVVIDPTNSVTGATFTNSNLLGNGFIAAGDAWTFENDVSGPGGVLVAGAINVAQGVFIDPLTITLEAGATLEGEPGAGVVAATIAAGSVIETLGSASIAFAAGLANSFILDGTLELLAGAAPYTVTLSNPAGSALFAAGAAVVIEANATLAVQTTLDNETTIQLAGGTLRIDQAPAKLGALQFATANSTLQIGVTGDVAFVPSATLEDLSASDTIVWGELNYAPPAHVVLNGDTLKVFGQNGSLDGTFTLLRHDAQTYALADFTLGESHGAMRLSVTGVTPLAAPVVTAGGFSFFTGGGSAVAIKPTLTLADPGSATLTSASISIGSYVAGDTLAFTNQSGITGSFDSAHGVLSLAGAASLAAWQTALRSITYQFTPGADPTDGGGLHSRTISWVVSDPAVTSLPATSTLIVSHAAPHVTAGNAASYIAFAAPAVLDPTLTVTDADSPTLDHADVVIASGSFTGNQDLLTADPTGTAITVSYDPLSGDLSLDGEDSVANYQAVLRTVAFSALGGDPTNAGANHARGFTWAVDDGVLFSGAAASTATVALSAGQPPVVTLAKAPSASNVATATLGTAAPGAGAAGDALGVSLTNDGDFAAGSTIVLNNGTLVYTPGLVTGNLTGSPDTIAYTVTDTVTGAVTNETQNVTLSDGPPPVVTLAAAPAASNATTATLGTAAPGLGTDALNVTLTSDADFNTGSTVVLNNGTLVYTPGLVTAAKVGADTIKYTVIDTVTGAVTTKTQTVKLSNAPGPIVTRAASPTATNTTSATLGTAAPGHGSDALSVTLTSDAHFSTGSTVVLSGGKLVYTAGVITPAKAGADSITYTVTDTVTGAVTKETQTVTIIDSILTLTVAPTTVTAAQQINTFIATDGALNSRDSLTGGPNTPNTLDLSGGGVFDLNAPKLLTNVQVADASEGQAAFVSGTTDIASTAQIVFLRDGLNVDLVVGAGTPNASNPNPRGITIYGGNDASVVNLGTGSDTVVLGSAAEEVFGGGGSALVQATAAGAGADVIGKATGTTTLEIAGGGTATLNANTTHVTVKLDAATMLTLSKAAFVTALGGNGGDTITAGAAGQVLTGGAGDTLAGFSGFGDTFRGTSAALNGDLIKLFGGSDLIDLTDVSFASLKPLAFAGGVLTLADGTHTSAISFAGSYATANFHAATDTHTGTLISFVP